MLVWSGEWVVWGILGGTVLVWGVFGWYCSGLGGKWVVWGWFGMVFFLFLHTTSPSFKDIIYTPIVLINRKNKVQ